MKDILFNVKSRIATSNATFFSRVSENYRVRGASYIGKVENVKDQSPLHGL